MIIFLNKIPMPTLRHYCFVSFGLTLIVFIYAQKVLHDIINGKFASENLDASYVEENGLVRTVVNTILNETWCIWILINFCYCGLFILSKILQKIVFGKLRAVENQHIKDNFWNFIFLKFIFIFGVLNLENVGDIIMWTTWFSVIGFLCIHCQICKDRFEYLLFSPTAPLRSHVKLILFLLFIQTCGFALLAGSIWIRKDFGLNICLFMFAEALTLTLRTLYVILKYSVHLLDLYNTEQNIINKRTINYYLDLAFEIGVISIDFLHYFHMLIYGNFYLSMASLVICMELKRLFFDLKRRLKRHTNYLRVIEKMEKRFPWANAQELADSEKCAVCWELLDTGRRLPCAHIFHQHCLRSWLEQHTSCPTCRKSLQDEKEQQQTATPTASNTTTTTTTANENNNNNQQQPTQATDQQQANQAGIDQVQQQMGNIQQNYFHFNGSRYFSWLPSFSIQVTNGGPLIPNLLRTAGAALDPERLNQMTDQVRLLFPNVAVDVIQRDLQLTHSVEITIENVLDGRIYNNALNRSVDSDDQANRSNNFFNDNDSSDNDEDDDDDDNSTDLGDDDDEDETNASNDLNRSSNIRHRNNLLANLLDGLNGSTTSEAGTSHNRSNTNATDNANTSTIDDDDEAKEAAFISKYSQSESLSANANNLMQRKRELILNSKKRFLEKNALKTVTNDKDKEQSTKTSWNGNNDDNATAVTSEESLPQLRLRSTNQSNLSQD